MSAPATPIVGANAPAAPGRTAAPPSVHSRRAALLLHALPPHDREWLLAQLSEEERSSLRTLVSELEALGIPPDRALVADLLGAVRPMPSPPTTPAAAPTKDAGEARVRAGDGPIESLDHADPALLADVLRNEPPVLVVRFLAVREWRWRNALLRELGKIQRRRVEDLLGRASGPRPGASATEAAGPAGALLQEHLAAKVWKRLQELQEERRGDQRPGRLGRNASGRRPSRAASWLYRLRKGARP